jgi:hypothetical protein
MKVARYLCLFIISSLSLTLPAKADSVTETLSKLKNQQDETNKNIIKNVRARQAPPPKTAGSPPTANSGRHK